MATEIKVVKVTRQITVDEVTHVDTVIEQMINQAQNRAVLEGGVYAKGPTVKIIVEQEYYRGN